MSEAAGTVTAAAAGFGGGAGGLAATFAGTDPGTWGVSTPPEPPAPLSARAARFGSVTVDTATTFAGTDPGTWGGVAAGPESVGELLAVDGFALVLSRGDERTRYTASDAPRKGLTALEIATEADALASWSATLPADRDLFDWAFSEVTIGHDGTRLFHGQLLPVKTAQTGTRVDVSGHGRLWELTSGGMTFSCSNCAGWQAINQFWHQIAIRTDGRVRGFALNPPAGTERYIGDEPLEFEGTPMSVLKELHGQFGYLFVMDHSDRSGVVESFRPGTQTRPATWRPTDHSIEIDPTAYHNKVVIRGAERPDGDRYRGEAIAPADEIERLTDGKIITYRPAPDDELTSFQACQSRAQSKLDELRGEWSVTGSIDAPPTPILPGYLYQVPEFSAAVPEAARPVRATARTVSHTLIGGPKTTIDFGSDRGIVGAIRRAQNPDLAPVGIQRRPGTGAVGASDDVYAGSYSHSYPGETTPTKN